MWLYSEKGKTWSVWVTENLQAFVRMDLRAGKLWSVWVKESFIFGNRLLWQNCIFLKIRHDVSAAQWRSYTNQTLKGFATHIGQAGNAFRFEAFYKTSPQTIHIQPQRRKEHEEEREKLRFLLCVLRALVLCRLLLLSSNQTLKGFAPYKMAGADCFGGITPFF